jgi:hypothetical protein
LSASRGALDAVLPLGFPVLLASIILAIVDAIIMFTGGVKDNYGRKLR